MSRKSLDINNNPIGIFDSGFGGLTVMSAVARLLPSEDIIYFGDTAHVPYGSKSREVVTSFSLAIANFLLTHKVKMIVIACNTASAFALSALKRRLLVPVIGVIDPGAKAALAVSSAGRIGVIGTEGTIHSHAYRAAIIRIDRHAKVFGSACPLFVPLVEEGWCDHPVTRQITGEYLAPLKKHTIDTLVLGCTHYPLLKKVLQKSIGPRIRLIDSAEATASEVAETLRSRGAAASKRKGRQYFFVSDAPQKFKTIGQMFLGYPLRSVKKVVLKEGV